MNPTLDTINHRRSVRAYRDEPLSDEQVTAILQAAYRAPTAGNMMLYSIIRVQDQRLKDRLAVTCDDQPFIAIAPLVLLFLADYQRWMDYYAHCGCEERARELGRATRLPGEGDLLLACCDALIAAQTAVIAAESLGIGSCYIGDILENYETHREIFALPKYALPVALLCFGFPSGEPPARLTPRFAPRGVTFTDRYQQLSGPELEELFAPSVERYFPNEKFPLQAQNFGQLNYLRKFTAPFSLEMTRSVKCMIQAWCAQEQPEK
jgi:FMN reductase (NADPH)/FMN reductase [NAD(P)H]